MEHMNPFLSFGQIIMLLLVLSTFLGIAQKIGSIALAILAFPIYLGLYAFEGTMFRINKNNIFALNLPKKHPWKLIMNICASLIMLSIIPLIIKLSEILQASITHDEQHLKTFELVIFNNPNIFSTITVSISMISLMGIYLISNFFSEIDTNSPWVKMENLTIPSLWKIITKEIT